jgi:hypothetical protein
MRIWLYALRIVNVLAGWQNSWSFKPPEVSVYQGAGSLVREVAGSGGNAVG